MSIYNNSNQTTFIGSAVCLLPAQGESWACTAELAASRTCLGSELYVSAQAHTTLSTPWLQHTTDVTTHDECHHQRPWRATRVYLWLLAQAHLWIWLLSHFLSTLLPHCHPKSHQVQESKATAECCNTRGKLDLSVLHHMLDVGHINVHEVHAMF